jgi:hypothetical protein
MGSGRELADSIVRASAGGRVGLGAEASPQRQRLQRGAAASAALADAREAEQQGMLEEPAPLGTLGAVHIQSRLPSVPGEREILPTRPGELVPEIRTPQVTPFTRAELLNLSPEELGKLPDIKNILSGMAPEIRADFFEAIAGRSVAREEEELAETVPGSIEALIAAAQSIREDQPEEGEIVDVTDFSTTTIAEQAAGATAGIDRPTQFTGRQFIEESRAYYYVGPGKDTLKVFSHPNYGEAVNDPKSGIRSATQIEINNWENRKEIFDAASVAEEAMNLTEKNVHLAALELGVTTDAEKRAHSEAIELIDRRTNSTKAIALYQDNLDEASVRLGERFTANQNDLNRSIQQGNLDETKRSNRALEALREEQFALDRRTQQLGLLSTISSNPAILFFMKKTGLMTGLVESLGISPEYFTGGVEIEEGIPFNIQELQAMSPQQRQFSLFAASASTGLSVSEIEQKLQGQSPGTGGVVRRGTLG